MIYNNWQSSTFVELSIAFTIYASVGSLLNEKIVQQGLLHWKSNTRYFSYKADYCTVANIDIWQDISTFHSFEEI